MITLFGIKNCDTVRKARKWLDNHGCDYEFHDLREDGIDANTIGAWLKHTDWQTLLNKRSTSWKQLDPAQRDAIDADTAPEAIIDLLLSHPTLIKRPVTQAGNGVLVGFSEEQYHAHFS